MLQTRGYKYELKLNNNERTRLIQCAGIARFAWNWGLAERLHRYKVQRGLDRYTDAMKQHKLLNKLKKTQFSWMYEVSKCIPQEALRDLDQVFQHFYRARKHAQTTKRKPRIGFPKFKKKHKAKDSFRLTGTIKFFPQTKLFLLRLIASIHAHQSISITFFQMQQIC